MSPKYSIFVEFDQIENLHTIMKRNTCLLLSLCAGQFAFAQDRPNIVVFLVDDMGLMDTSLPFLTDENGNAER